MMKEQHVSSRFKVKKKYRKTLARQTVLRSKISIGYANSSYIITRVRPESRAYSIARKVIGMTKGNTPIDRLHEVLDEVCTHIQDFTKSP